jgi:hypothetical protein
MEAVQMARGIVLREIYLFAYLFILKDALLNSSAFNLFI